MSPPTEDITIEKEVFVLRDRPLRYQILKLAMYPVVFIDCVMTLVNYLNRWSIAWKGLQKNSLVSGQYTIMVILLRLAIALTSLIKELFRPLTHTRFQVNSSFSCFAQSATRFELTLFVFRTSITNDTPIFKAVADSVVIWGETLKVDSLYV